MRFSIERDIRGVAGDGIEIGEIERVQPQGFAERTGQRRGDRKSRARCFEPADNDRALAGDGGDGAAALEIEHGDDLEGMVRHGGSVLEFVVLVHEWVTGGGLAGMPLPASWEREGRAHAQGDRP